ncbi:MAG: sugar phosphate isomerase/epimerase [Candidatus Hydrogenedentes bacterium]|nr:sugar phosphate isomerase/epimerase [Candidatus Hydrogenedentota bacterium]
MQTTRRQFIGRSSAVLGALVFTKRALAEEKGLEIRLSACDWSLGVNGPESIAYGKSIGLDGVEVSSGGPGDTLPIADANLRAEYKKACEAAGIVVSSTAMGFLNDNPFVSEEKAPQWLEQTISGTQDLGARVILLAFFGKGDLLKENKLKTADVDILVERVKAAAPLAEKSGVILGLENYLSAKDNLAILDRIQSNAVKVYYDVGNSTHKKYDVPAEIRMLGDRICQFHFKDGASYLGEGKVDMKAVGQAMRDIRYSGWVVLETSCPSTDRVADFKKNAEFARKLLGASA